MATGICRICGSYGSLTFEHVPPKAAFNQTPVYVGRIRDNIGAGPGPLKNAQQSQRGAGHYSLCGKCNNLTGHWYGPEFAKWCYQGRKILRLTEGKPSLLYLHYLIPLRIIKQILVMFAAIQSDNFPSLYPEIGNFILNRDRSHLSPRFHVFLYYNLKGQPRRAPLVVSGKAQGNDLFGHPPIYISEISHPPFGYVLTIDSMPRDKRLAEITWFSGYDYNEFKVMSISLSVLQTWMWFPEDYGTLEEVRGRPFRKPGNELQ